MNSIIYNRKIRFAIVFVVALTMILTFIPFKAAASGGSVKIDIFVQDPNNPDSGAFIVARNDVVVNAGLAGEYGYEYAASIDPTKDVTALDAIVAAHIEKYGASKELINTKLKFEGDWIVSAFEGTVGFWMTYVNGSSPNDGIYTEFGFTGYPSKEAKISNGDAVTIFASKGMDPADNIAHYEMDGKRVDAITVKAGEPFDLYVKGYSSALMFEKTDSINEATSPLENVIIDILDLVEPGAVFQNSASMATTDSAGKATMTFTEAGTFTIGASYDPAAPNAIMAPAMTVNVTYDGVDVIKTPLLERLVFPNNPGTLAPIFSSDVKDYTYTLRDVFDYVIPQGITRSQHVDVVYSLDEKEYMRGEPIPVQDGSVIEMTVTYIGVARPPGEEPEVPEEIPAPEDPGEGDPAEPPVDENTPDNPGEESPADGGQPTAENPIAEIPAPVTETEPGPVVDEAPRESNVYTITIKQERKSSGEFADVGIPSIEVLQADIAKVAKFEFATVSNPTVGVSGGEWTVIGLARSGNMTNAYKKAYLKNLTDILNEKDGVLTDNLYTEYSRVVLALSALNTYPTNIGGYDLLTRLAEFEKINAQGVNGATYALLALDSRAYDMPSLPPGSSSSQAKRETYVTHIVEGQNSDGGFSLTSDGKSDVDVTAMAIQALSPYCDGDANVAIAVDNALSWLSSIQDDTGSFGNIAANSQVMIALNTRGLSIDDAEFVKNGYTIYDALMVDFLPNEGAFRLSQTNDTPDAISTDQGFCALISLYRYLQDQNTLFDMTDDLVLVKEMPWMHIGIAAAILIIIIIIIVVVAKKNKKVVEKSSLEKRREKKK